MKLSSSTSPPREEKGKEKEGLMKKLMKKIATMGAVEHHGKEEEEEEDPNTSSSLFFPLWEHLLQNEDVFSIVLSFLNPTERKFVTHVSSETRRVMLKTLKMQIVSVQRYRSIAQKKQLEKDQKRWSEEEEAGRKINLKSVDWKTYSPWLRLAKDTSTIPDKFTIKECRGTGQLEIALDFCVLNPPKEIECFVEDGTINEEYFVHNVARTNEISLLKWAREVKRMSWNSEISGVATEQGNVQMLKYVVRQFARDKSFDKNEYDHELHAAAQKGHLDCVQFLLEHVGGFQKTRLKGGYWRQTEGEFIIYHAAASNQLHVVEYLLSQGSPVTSDALVACCASSGSLECLKYLRENSIRRVDWTWGCVAGAAAIGDLEIVKYCVNDGCPLEVPLDRQPQPDAITSAVDFGHLNVVRFLREERGFELDIEHIMKALSMGNVELLKYIWFHQTFPIPEDFFGLIWKLWVQGYHQTLDPHFPLCWLLRRKKQTEHFLCVKFLYEEVQIPTSEDAYWRIYELALTWGDCALLEWVFEKIKKDFSDGYDPRSTDIPLPWPEPQHCEYAAGKGYLDCLQFLHKIAKFRVCTHTSEPMDSDTIKVALRNCQPECARYAFEMEAYVVSKENKRNFSKQHKNDVRKQVEVLESIAQSLTFGELEEAREVMRKQFDGCERCDEIHFDEHFHLFRFENEWHTSSDDESYGSEDLSDEDDLSFSSSSSSEDDWPNDDEWSNHDARSMARILDRKIRRSIEQQCLEVNGALPTEREMQKLLKQVHRQNPGMAAHIESVTQGLPDLSRVLYPRSGRNRNNNGRGGRGGRAGRGRGGGRHAISGEAARDTSNVPCVFFAKGTCNKGNACKFSHHASSAAEGAGEVADTSNVPCLFFAKGRCKYGEACKFSHQT